MQSTEEQTVAQEVKQVIQYSIGCRFDPGHRQREANGEREREMGDGGRERDGGGGREMAPPISFFFFF